MRLTIVRMDSSGRIKLYKIMHRRMNHYGFQYRIGLNVLVQPFNPDGNCLGGGLYFCKFENVIDWLHLYNNGIICEVYIPKNALVCEQKNKYKADRIIIENPISIEEFIEIHNLEYRAVVKDGLFLRYCRRQTHNLCIEAIKKIRMHGNILKNQRMNWQ